MLLNYIFAVGGSYGEDGLDTAYRPWWIGSVPYEGQCAEYYVLAEEAEEEMPEDAFVVRYSKANLRPILFPLLRLIRKRNSFSGIRRTVFFTGMM